MKINKVLKLSVTMLAGITLLSACGNNNKSEHNEVGQAVHKETKKEAEIRNAKTVIKVINKKDPKLKVYVDGEYHISPVLSSLTAAANKSDYEKEKDTSYGYDDENKGISIGVFALRNGLNRTQADLVYGLFWDCFDAINDNGNNDVYTPKLSDFENITFKNIKLKDQKIQSTYVLHYKDKTGEEKEKSKRSEYKLGSEDADDKQFSAKDKKVILHSDKRNEDINYVGNTFDLGYPSKLDD